MTETRGLDSPGRADVAQLLDASAAGDPKAAAEFLPMEYDELRKLAAARMAVETSGRTLPPTALANETFVRLVDGNQARH